MAEEQKESELSAQTFLIGVLPTFIAGVNLFEIGKGLFCVEVSSGNAFGRTWCELMNDDFRPDLFIPMVVAPAFLLFTIWRWKLNDRRLRNLGIFCWVIGVASFVLRYCFSLWLPGAENY